MSTPVHVRSLLCTAIVMRDTQEMGRDLDQVLSQYINSVKPAFEEFTLPVNQSQPSFMLHT